MSNGTRRLGVGVDMNSICSGVLSFRSGNRGRGPWSVLAARGVLAAGGVLAALAFASPAAHAQSAGAKPNDATITSEDIAFAKRLSRAFQNVARKVEPSVVHISTFRLAPEYTSDGFFSRPTGRTRLAPSGVGSGVIVSADGTIVTNNHVVSPPGMGAASAITVKLRDGSELDAEVVGGDPLTDVAVLRIKNANGRSFVPAEWAGSEDVEVGEWVVAIGSPFGFANTVTSGIVSAKGRSIALPGQREGEAYQDFIQTDAAINPGNSGGPLLNLEGKIVGINSAIASRAGGSEGIGFAIPSPMARSVMESILKNGRVARGFLGVSLAEARGKMVESMPVPKDGGVLVTGLEPDGPARNAGLQENDIITRFQGRSVGQVSSLRAAIATTPPGTPVEIEVYRDGKPVAIKATVADQGDYRDRQITELASKRGLEYVRSLGVLVRRYTKDDSRRDRFRRSFEGVYVADVVPDSRAARAGLLPGDVVLAVGEDEVSSAEQLMSELAKSDFAAGVRLDVVRTRTGDRGTLQVKDE